MTLLTSLNTAVNGLTAQAYAVGNTSNNLANASTTAFKAATTSFEDIVFSCDAESSSYSGKAGSLASTTNHNDSQGTISSSLSGTNLAINGNGFFAVQTAIVTATDMGGVITYTTTFNPDIYYTRCGDFSMNESGYLENSEGFYLMGYAVDPLTGVAGTTLVPVNIDTTLGNTAISTTALDYSANLNAEVDAGTTSSLASVTIYSSYVDGYTPTTNLNNTHDISFSWEKTAANAWTLTVSAPGGTGGADYSASIGVTIDTTDPTSDTFGKISTIAAGAGYTVTGTTISFDLGYLNSDPQTITCDLADLTQFALSPSTTQATEVSSFFQNGVPEGSYSGIEIDGSGNVGIDYTNGISIIAYEIALATFVNPNDLEAMSGNAYKSTIASGDATYTTAGNDGAGVLKAGSLELSNVDIGSEFSTLIKTQQVYSANAKVVSAVNSMMQTLIQMQSI